MTVVQGRLCLQGLERSSVCGPEAGSVPTVPWQENLQPSQPWQLGNLQGAMENWRAAGPRLSWGGGGWTRNMVFYIILVERGDGLFCVWWAKLNLDLWLQPCLLIVLRWLWLSSGRQVMLTGLAKETFKFESNLWFSPKMIHSSLGILGKPSDICHLPRTT